MWGQRPEAYLNMGEGGVQKYLNFVEEVVIVWILDGMGKGQYFYMSEADFFNLARSLDGKTNELILGREEQVILRGGSKG